MTFQRFYLSTSLLRREVKVRGKNVPLVIHNNIGAHPTAAPAALTLIETDDCTPHNAYIAIPNLSPDGSQPIPIVPTGTQHFQDRVCGSDFGIEGGVAGPLVCKFYCFSEKQS